MVLQKRFPHSIFHFVFLQAANILCISEYLLLLNSISNFFLMLYFLNRSFLSYDYVFSIFFFELFLTFSSFNKNVDQQKQLGLIYDRFKEEVNLHLKNCRSTVEDLEADQIEIKGALEKQSMKTLVFLFWFILYLILVVIKILPSDLFI